MLSWWSMNFWGTIQWMWMCVKRFFRTWATSGIKESKEALSSLHMKLEALTWGMKSLLHYLSCQHFRTNWKDLILVIQESKYDQNFSMKLKELSILNKRLQDFKSTYHPQAQNQIVNSWVKTAQTFHRIFLLIVLFLSDFLYHLLIE